MILEVNSFHTYEVIINESIYYIRATITRKKLEDLLKEYLEEEDGFRPVHFREQLRRKNITIYYAYNKRRN